MLFEHDQPAANHNGGALLFDPDGMLVLALGDGGGAGDQFGNGQDPGTQLGALLRFDADAGELAPADGNPFLDGGGDPRGVGLRAAQPVAHRLRRHAPYVADVGQDAVEEVDVVARDEVAGRELRLADPRGHRVLRASPTATRRDDPARRRAPPRRRGVLDHRRRRRAPGHASGLGGHFLYSDLCDTQLRSLLRDADGDEVETAVVDGAALPASPLGFGTGRRRRGLGRRPQDGGSSSSYR